jgi:hypothetical protein
LSPACQIERRKELQNGDDDRTYCLADVSLEETNAGIK